MSLSMFIKPVVYTLALLFPVTAWATIESGSQDDYLPSIVYNPADGSLTIDTGAGYGGPDPIYNVVVYSDLGIFYPFYASQDFAWYTDDYTLATMPYVPLYDGDVIGEPGFMLWGETESFLQDDLTFIWQFDPDGDAYYGDMVYLQDLEGDLNKDGFVGIGDLNIVLGNWNQNVSPGDWTLGDPSGDGYVGIQDLNVVLGNWNAGTPPTSVVPEPGVAVLWVLTAGVVALRRIEK